MTTFCHKNQRLTAASVFCADRSAEPRRLWCSMQPEPSAAHPRLPLGSSRRTAAIPLCSAPGESGGTVPATNLSASLSTRQECQSVVPSSCGNLRRRNQFFVGDPLADRGVNEGIQPLKRVAGDV